MERWKIERFGVEEARIGTKKLTQRPQRGEGAKAKQEKDYD